MAFVQQTSAIDDVHRTISKFSTTEDAKIKEGNGIVKGLSTLKYELQHNRELTPLSDDGGSDIHRYNQELESLPKPTTWFNVPWLFTECYLYRRMRTLFATTQYWSSYDVFGRSKLSTFKSSRPAVLELASRYHDIVTQIEKESHVVKGDADPNAIVAAERVLFKEMTEICLWGNATDLSLLTSLTYEDIQKLQGSNARKESEKNILVNDLDKAFDVLTSKKNANSQNTDDADHGIRVDIVLDNAGFEIFVDLILAGYLLATGLATEVILHPKTIPWFVSDVIPKDFAELLNVLADPQAFYTESSEAGEEAASLTAKGDSSRSDKTVQPLSEMEIAHIKFLFDHWSQLHEDGKLILRPNTFWTEGGSYWRLPANAPELFEDLKESELVIFKGDLNYRKLTADVQWPPTTAFPTSIGPLGVPNSGIRTLALRTCKADVVVGLPAGKDEELKMRDVMTGKENREEKKKKKVTEHYGQVPRERKWAWSGKWAVIQFCDGKAAV